MDELLKNVKILLNVSIQQLNDEEIKRTDDASEEIWNTIERVTKEKDLSGIELTTASLATLHQIFDFIMEMTRDDE